MTRRRMWTLAAVCAATFMLLVDITIVQVALPRIQRDLHASLTSLQWVIDAYALALAALILSSGSLADRFGRKRVFMVGIAVFTAGSVLCGLARSADFLIAARAIQGVGGAAMFATSLALIGQEFHGAERATAIAAWGSTVGVAIALGPLVGGIVTETLGWQWIFFVNVPIGLASMALSQPLLANVSDPAAARLDVGGLVCFSGALFGLVFALQRGNSAGWASVQIVVPLVAAALLLAAFVALELRQEHAMFDLALFRNRTFCGVSVATFLLGAGMFSMMVFIALFLQNLLGFSPLGGGVRMLPMTSLVFVVPLLVRRFLAAVPQRVMLSVGMAFVSLGLLLMHDAGAHSSWTVLLPGLVAIGIGIGLANPAIATTGLGVVAPSRTGMASGISNTFRIAGLATGVAAIGAIFKERISSSLAASVPHAPAHLADLVASSGVHHLGGGAHVAAAARVAFVSGFDSIALVGACATLIGAIAALLLVRGRDFARAGNATVASGAPREPVLAGGESRR
ncbi:MAG TPA: MFS transporter [Solirubrobacteraceae bacterium]|nr:MFS transporter [Solirubrobacteraceae bacterium]